MAARAPHALRCEGHIVSHKNDHGASYRRYGVLPWRSRLTIDFCEIFDVVRFSTYYPQQQTSAQASQLPTWTLNGHRQREYTKGLT